MINGVFRLVAASLSRIASFIGCTYEEINILVYFFIIPFSWAVMLDYALKFHYFKISFLIMSFGFFLGCRDFEAYSDRLFKKSVDFLNLFNNIGSTYVASSVWICVALPMVIYAILIWVILK